MTRVVYVDTLPLGEGRAINDRLPVVNGEIPLPDWSVFDEEDLIDLDDRLRARFRATALPVPARVAADRQVLGDPRRYDVPIAVIISTYTADELRELLAGDHAATAELARVRDVTIVGLPTGHWPQFTKPTELAAAIIDALV